MDGGRRWARRRPNCLGATLHQRCRATPPTAAVPARRSRRGRRVSGTRSASQQRGGLLWAGRRRKAGAVRRRRRSHPPRVPPRRGGADRAAARRADWPCGEQSEAALAAHRQAPWGADGAEQGARAPRRLVAAPHGGQEAMQEGAARSPAEAAPAAGARARRPAAYRLADSPSPRPQVPTRLTQRYGEPVPRPSTRLRCQTPPDRRPAHGRLSRCWTRSFGRRVSPLTGL